MTVVYNNDNDCQIIQSLVFSCLNTNSDHFTRRNHSFIQEKFMNLHIYSLRESKYGEEIVFVMLNH